MNEKCIGEQNKDGIQSLKTKIQLLEKDVSHLRNNINTLENNMVKATAIHELQLEINNINNKLNDMSSNRKEDRLAISKLSSSIDEIMSKIEEDTERSAEMLGHQIVSKGKQDGLEKKQDDFSKIMDKVLLKLEQMDEKIDKSSVVEQLKRFYHKSTFNKWTSRLIIILLGIFIASVFSFFMSGGSTFFEILNQLKELIT